MLDENKHKIKVFYSHTTEYRNTVQRVDNLTSVFGVNSFIAHIGIGPGTEWQQEIFRALDSSVALVAFLNKGFSQSPYCNQEVGWAKARSLPILPLNFGEKSSGMLVSIQSSREFIEKENEAAFEIICWLMNESSNLDVIHSHAIESLATSNDWEQIKIIVRFLEIFGIRNEGEIRSLFKARELNSRFKKYYPLEEDQHFVAWLKRLSNL